MGLECSWRLRRWCGGDRASGDKSEGDGHVSLLGGQLNIAFVADEFIIVFMNSFGLNSKL